MKRILIFGNSGGIGAAIQKMCIAKGHSVSGLSRTQDGLDLSDENKIVSAIESLDGTFDQIFITTGALVVNAAEPEKLFDSYLQFCNRSVCYKCCRTYSYFKAHQAIDRQKFKLLYRCIVGTCGFYRR